MERISTLRSEHLRRLLFRRLPFLIGFWVLVLVPGYAESLDARTLLASEGNGADQSSARESGRASEGELIGSFGELDLIRLRSVRSELELFISRTPSLVMALHEMPWPTSVSGVSAESAAWTVTAFERLSDYLRSPDASTLASLRQWCESQRDSDALTQDQRRYLGALRRRFPIWEGVVAGDLECRRLAQLLERIEWNHPEQSEQEFLATVAAMTRSEVPTIRERGEHLSRTWSAPNLRTTVSLELFRHLIPPRRRAATENVEQEPEIRVRLIPDDSRAHLRLETTGSLLSLPESTAPGQVRLTASGSEFHAWKDVQVTGNGVELLPTQAVIRERPAALVPQELRNLFPPLSQSPEVLLTHDLFGNPSPLAYLQITRDLRRAIQRDRQATLAQAKQYLDREGEHRVGTVRQRIEDRLLDPLQEMRLGPMVRSASTTEDHAFFSLGIRTPDQCGGYTPVLLDEDPRTVLTIQIHESAINNLIHQVGLNGTSSSLLEIQNRVAVRFNSPELLMAEPSDGRFVVTFPEQDALRLQTQRDQTVRVTLRITKFLDQYEGTTWNDLEVRAVYRMVMSPEEIRLERTEPIQLRGPGLGGESQLRLRAIFGRIFGREGYSTIRPGDIFSIESLQSLRFLSTRIADGWIQLELGMGSMDD